MGSFVEAMKDQLEESGEYVVRSNTRWFAVFAKTWQERLEIARRQGRKGPNLIVYRNKSNDPRDHHVIPYLLVRNLLVDETLTRSKVNQSVRWNLTLNDDELHVSHRVGKLNVIEFRRARLIVEDEAADQLPELLEQEAAFKANVELCLKDSAPTRRARLKAATKHPAKVLTLAQIYARNPDVVAEVLLRANGVCEICLNPAPFRRAKDGSPYLEVHHKIQLSANGEDTVENAIAVCPNCHRHAHFGQA
jgi:hypothetical protein